LTFIEEQRMQLEKARPREVTGEMIADMVWKIVENFSPEKIMLFGSRVWGKPGEWSDVDMLVIIKSHEPTAQLSAKIATRVKPRFVPVDILVRTPDEIEHRIKIGDHFIKKILAHGKLLYERRAGQ